MRRSDRALHRVRKRKRETFPFLPLNRETRGQTDADLVWRATRENGSLMEGQGRGRCIAR